MANILQFDDEAHQSLLKGLKVLAKAVTVTLGPNGRYVVIDKPFGVPLSTNDGATVAKEIVLGDKFANMGAQLAKAAAARTAEAAGDGSTTAIVLANAIYTEGMKGVAAGANPTLVKRGIDHAVRAVVNELQAMAKPMGKIGRDGAPSVPEGIQLDGGYLSPYFVTNPGSMRAELDNCSILLVAHRISAAEELVPLLGKIAKVGVRPLLIVADDIEGEALSTLVVNKLKAGLSVCAVKAPGFGDRRKAMLDDLAVRTGGTVITADVGLKLAEVGPEVLGRAKRVEVGEDRTTIIGGIGVNNEVSEGVVPGGGVGLLRAAAVLDALTLAGDEETGKEAVRRACLAPATAIATNCGRQGTQIAEKISEGNGPWGYNGLNDEFGDLLEAGVIDPVMVTIAALSNAAAVAGMLLTTAAIVTDRM